jgi:hypothetical protein
MMRRVSPGLLLRAGKDGADVCGQPVTASSPAAEYVQAFVARVMSEGDVLPQLPRDIVETVFYELSRQEEYATSRRDLEGNWDWTFSEAQRRGELYVPHTDRCLKTWVCKHDSRLWTNARQRRWPQGKTFAICLTHDVDLVSRHLVSFRDCSESIRRILCTTGHRIELVRNSARLVAKRLLYPVWVARMPSDDYWHLENWLMAEDRFGFKSTWFFMAGRLPVPHKWDTCYDHRGRVVFDDKRVTVREMMREIRRRGWDIGLHGSYNSAVDLRVLTDERRQVEDSCGEEVRSVRQHYLHYDVNITPKVQAQAGLRADSTQGFNRVVGFRAGTCFPYFCWDHQDGQALDILEVPQHAMDGALFMDFALGYDKEIAIRHMLRLMDEVAEMGGCLTLNWHANRLSDPVYWDTYVALLSEAKSRNAWGCSVQQLYEWWLRQRT